MAIEESYHTIQASTPRSRSGLAASERSSRPTVRQWLWFALQLGAIAALQSADDIVRGNIEPPNMAEAIRHARVVAGIERAHGFFVEPALQLWVRHAHALFGILSYGTIGRATDLIYALGQTLVPLGVAVWLFLRHRSRFPVVRDVTFLSTLLALVGYEVYPTAPPRLTSGLIYDHRIFHFQDTVQHVIGDGKLNGVPIGYNAYSAIPSLHIAWALILAASVALLARRPLVRLAAALYPLLMLFTVVATANHFLLDAVGGALTVALAAMAALVLERYRRSKGPSTGGKLARE
ncbi:MAG: phosphatase PAP2 family protein [Chloroflexi bacterium]|nr:phosphatase PAP2 family protein [Chloroflexota bacterium]